MRRYLPCFILCFAIFGLLFTGGCATRAHVWDLEERLEAVVKENEQLRQALSGTNDSESDGEHFQDALGDFAARQQAELYEMRTRIRRISGTIEEIEYKLQRDVGALEDDMAELRASVADNAEMLERYDQRISGVESFVGVDAFRQKEEESGEQAQPAAEAFGEMEEEALYATAKKMFDNGDYDSALDGFEVFLAQFPASDYADNARFWTGEVFFAEEWYERAIVEYQKVIDEYPEGEKVPAAYLKQGIAFAQIGEDENALYILKELVSKFPDRNQARIAESWIRKLE